MSSSPQPGKVLRFGLFELDAAALELRKSGVRLRIQPQPFKVLTLLATRTGRIVTREDLRRELWGNETFVDFEQGLNYCIRQIRAVLGDEAQTPRFVETIPRRGYRFIASVEGLEEKTAQESQASVVPEKRVVWRAIWLTASAAVVILGVLAVAGYVGKVRAAHLLTEKDTVVLADFTNRTGDPVFDGTLKQGLSVALGQSPFLNVLSDRRVGGTLRMMGHPSNEPITGEVAREVCLRTGSKALLGGAIFSIGRTYLIDLKAVACGTGDTLAEEQVEAANKEDVLKSLSRASSSLRTKLGESLPSVQKFDVPIEATTSSLEALKNYSVGLALWREKGDAASIPLFRRAIELDPNFPMAYAALGRVYNNLMQPSQGLEYVTKAYELRDRASDIERLRITLLYSGQTGDYFKAVQSNQLWAANYPRDFYAHASLGANYAHAGQYENAVAEKLEAIRLSPDDGHNYSTLALTYINLNQWGNAKGMLDKAVARKLDSGSLHQNLYFLAFLEENQAQMDRQITWAAGRPGEEDLLLSTQSDTEAYYGRLTKAHDFSRRATDSALRADSKEIAAFWRVNAALRDAELGDTATARQGVKAALQLYPGPNVKLVAALTLARIGDTAQAKALADEEDKAAPADTFLHVYWLPTIKAACDVSRGSSTQALADLEPTAPYELGQTDVYINYLYPAYVRGQAYLLAHNGAAAAAEFRKVLDHRGIVLNFVTGALAYLQMGRAFAMTRDTKQAKTAYQNFFALWKDADPSIPLYKQAKVEYARLK